MPTLRLPHLAAATLLGVGAAQATDAITFVRLMLDHGAAAEANPLAAHFAGSGMLGPLLLAKLATVALVLAAVLVAERRYPLVAAIVVTAGVGAGIIGATSNVLVLVHPYLS
jgi:uncharacterized protein DUF5658